MKKILALFTVFAVLMGSVFAQTIGDNPDDPFERERFEKEKLTTQTSMMDLNDVGLSASEIDKNATVKIEYQPMHDELRIYYETLMVTFDKGEAMNAVKACLEKFVKENKYYNYRYMETDKVKSIKDDRGQRKTIYSSHIKLIR
jgi:hypothetical protein